MSQKEGEQTGILFVAVEQSKGVITGAGGNREKLHVKSQQRMMFRLDNLINSLTDINVLIRLKEPVVNNELVGRMEQNHA